MHFRFTRTIFVLLAGMFALPAAGDGPGDNSIANVRPIPPPGEPVEPATKAALETKLADVEKQLAAARNASPPDSHEWYADVAVLTRGVRLALTHDTFYRPRDAEAAKQLLDLAERRLAEIAQGKRGFELLASGVEPRDGHRLLIGGFISHIDGTPQPYGLIVPADWDLAQPSERRLDVWLHGRGERELELQFLDNRQRDKGYFAPSNALVLHPFGRYSNAFKFAGETDVMEAIEHLRKLTTIDEQRISIRGFSMGGAGCWQFAVHYPGFWMAATPGAGFSETMEFLRVFQKEEYPLDASTRKLLNWYDCPPWINNLRNLPTIAYSGELDRQRQAAEVMVAAAQAQGVELPHVIGPQTEHKIHPESQTIIAAQLDQWAEQGRPLVRSDIDFTTYTLRYADCDWLQINGMEEHWTPARVQAHLNSQGDIAVNTQGTTHLNLSFAPEQTNAQSLSGLVQLDGADFHLDPSTAGSPWQANFAKQDGGWVLLDKADASLRKHPGLQGPIDDAFSSSFLVVTPSRPCVHGAVQRWTAKELDHVRDEWTKQFRGELREVADTAITPEMIRDHNLVIFGDPQANRLLAQLLPHLPIKWDTNALQVAGKEHPVETSTVAMIFPNPLNPERYIVLNSGFTYRQYAYLNNARQIAHLPDWAAIDVSEGANARLPGNILDSGFFNESWQHE